MRTWAYILPVVILLAMTLPHLDQGDFRTDTARYAAVGLQSWQDHSLFWTPHLQPEVPYFNKPPLVLWIHGLVLHLFGISLIAARLPTILAAMGCVLLTVAITRRLMGSTAAVATGTVLALTYEFVRRTREISLDMWQLAFMLATLFCVLEAVRRRRPLVVWSAGIPLGLALMCKPLTALLVLPFLVMGMRGTRQQRHLPGLLLVALWVAAPWHLSMWHLHGAAFTARYFGHEVMNRALGRLNQQPGWYYVIEMGRSYWPWMIPAVLSAGLLLRGKYSPRRTTGLTLAGIWFTLWFVALTLFPDKHPRYELPLYPALAILCGSAIVRLPWKSLRLWHRHKIPWIMTAVIAGMGALAACLPLRVQAPPDPHLAAWVKWIEQTGANPVYSAALQTNDEGYFFLKTGRWPKPAPSDRISGRASLPAGSLLVYSSVLPLRPGSNEETVFSSGPITVTRLSQGGWTPSH